MPKPSLRVLGCLLVACLQAQAAPVYALVIHGGAGYLTRARLGADGGAAYRAGLQRALDAGYAVLAKGGPALDAVEAAVRVLEDDPHFNAGVGATVTKEGVHELDAAVMDGRTRAAGAVTGLRHVRSPILLARRVMERSPHVLLAGEGAEAFAWAQGLERVENAFFDTPETLEAWRKAREKAVAPPPVTKDTVGAVALDQAGHLAAATSTGGMFGKLPGRVGDAPLIGSGTWADDATCAVSCTGSGEYFIRAAVAHDVAARMAYARTPLDQAAVAALARARALGGEGGLVALDAQGHMALPFDTPGMLRAWRRSDGETGIRILPDAEEAAAKKAP